MSISRAALLLTASALTVALNACAAGTDEPTATEPVAEPPACHKEHLPTLEPGVLTLATKPIAVNPWYINNQPENGQGYESAVAYAVAEKLGYNRSEVRWIRTEFTDTIAPGDKPFDLNLSEVTITEERRQAVDFSSGYYNPTHAFLTTAQSPAAGITTRDELSGVRLGARTGTTNHQTAVRLSGEYPAIEFATDEEGREALLNGDIDVLVLDLRTAFSTQLELPGSVIIGQLEPEPGNSEQYGIVLAKDSPLTDCVSQAVDELGDNGDLFRLQKEWLAGPGAAPFLP
ncbi:ABC transporter substrate-binding protein [Mycolicibacterium thermoresistibile]|uniref:Family 3 extracellular solute-binding protein n=2 Tax=Mycolicibacterium thermoresistibile TaxID=1797 RepID=G7CGK7_MYCT3|nr:transporter substrate-binding domain-containing protein [Mycolicibacterium thermoresistibile]EHI11967.1 family 3 extracellular solute-binding protein [Mycolicibacterium thermoresistibile ATCC 19527]MCV7188956.1 amino acid ABC transporter substrate-binding protein [Mycolicibacterium thermoresistibile]GAT14859.1 family 3 extracellular solute-binding protein [Mycolicibacterium thermoresistibile]SNW20082.1 periplasmic component of amino acid ABC-type transporter/signal transduction system [Mycol